MNKLEQMINKFKTDYVDYAVYSDPNVNLDYDETVANIKWKELNLLLSKIKIEEEFNNIPHDETLHTHYYDLPDEWYKIGE